MSILVQNNSAAAGRLAAVLIALLPARITPAAALENIKVEGEAASRPAPKADSAEFGLLLPDEEPKPGGDRLVLTRSTDDELVVAKTLLEVGDRQPDALRRYDAGGAAAKLHHHRVAQGDSRVAGREACGVARGRVRCSGVRQRPSRRVVRQVVARTIK